MCGMDMGKDWSPHIILIPPEGSPVHFCSLQCMEAHQYLSEKKAVGVNGTFVCPMCGEDMEAGVAERVCEFCRMGMTADRPYHLVYRPGQLRMFCSAKCVRSALLTEKHL
jgi:PHP family Zn ribbon phosphoesterase